MDDSKYCTCIQTDADFVDTRGCPIHDPNAPEELECQHCGQHYGEGEFHVCPDDTSEPLGGQN